MHTLTSMCRGAALAAGLILVAAPAAHADGDPYTGGTAGGQVMYQGGQVTFTLLYQRALYENELFVFASAIGNAYDPANAVNIFSNRNAIGSTFSFDPSAELGLSTGDELIFAICTNVPSGSPIGCGSFGSANAVLYSGPAERNFDNAVHARVDDGCSVASICGSFSGGHVVAFEDIREVDPMLTPDHDFNDIVFGVTQTPTTVIPEPMTMSLLASGLVGMSGAGIFRRRNRKK